MPPRTAREPIADPVSGGADASDSDDPLQAGHASGEGTTFDDLRQALLKCNASFCVGGHIPIQSPASTDSQTSTSSAIPPVTLRWDLPNHAPNALTIQFPISDPNSEIFNKLLKACEPATFGLGAKDVLDEEYRKAGKLDNTQFAVSFHPSDHGIIDTIAQTLLPRYFGGPRADHHGVKAELYKLNVYSGPGGKFKAHVDTPRAKTQFGSLVVCLPSPFKGGKLRVSHNGANKLFDWSSTNPGTIQWAAFYSDCEHEIREVLNGHRITLTYNLYCTDRVDATLQAFPAADPRMFPLFKVARGTLGFHCVHAYPHTDNDADDIIPYALKGKDCILFSVFRELGLDPVARPVLKEQFDEYESRRYDSNDDSDAGKDPVGYYFHGVAMGGELEGGGVYAKRGEIARNWPLERKAVHWINHRSGNTKLAYVGIAHGNQASLWWQYSTAAIFIEVPAMTANGRGVVSSSE